MSLPRGVAYCALLCYPFAKYSSLNYMTCFYRVIPTYLVLWIGYHFLIYPNLLSPLRHLPTVNGGYWWSRESLRLYYGPKGVPQSEWIDQIPHNGLVRYRTLFNGERIIAASPEALADVLTTKSYHFKKPATFVTALEPITGMGILLAEDDEHRAQRKALSPAFSFRHVKELYGVMWDISAHAVNKLMSEVSSTPQEPFVVDIADWASHATLNIICVAGLGQELDSVLNQDADYAALRQTYRNVLSQSRQDIIFAILRIWVLPGWILPYVPLRRSKQLGQASHTLRTICRQLIQRRKTELQDEVADEAEKNILTVALASGGFSEENLVDQLLTFLAAGHETTSIAVSWAIYALSVHPDMQTRLRDEIRGHLPSPSATSHQDLHSVIDILPYLNAVCQEVLRYFPPVMVTFREAAVDTDIQGTFIPKGTRIVICPLATNRDKSLWGEDARVFNPERHLSTKQADHFDGDLDPGHKGGSKANYATLTFLHGPRSCIGQSFARAELAILLANLVGRFDFALADESLKDEAKIVLRRGATLRPKGGMQVKVKVLGGW